MNEDHYTKVDVNSNYQIFRFISEGRNGKLVKIVRFDELYNITNTYNLALGTLLLNGKIDFVSITNNGDRNKILATVAHIIFKFIEKNPGKTVYLTGSDNRRTLLYQRAIIYAYDNLDQMFNIYGDTSPEDDTNEFEVFDKTKIYYGFLIEKRN